MNSTKIFLFFTLLVTGMTTWSQGGIDLLILKKEYTKALEEIERNLADKPTAELYFTQGLVFNQLQDYQNAAHSFSTALNLDSTNTLYLTELGDVLSVLGNNYDAEGYYRRAVALNPDNLTVAGKLGKVTLSRKKYLEAYEIFNGIYKQDSSNVYWNKQLAYCAFRIGKRHEAIKLYEKVLLANPRDHGSYINLIHACNWKKEGDKILETIRSGLKEFPNDQALLLERANYFFRMKHYEAAMMHYASYFETGGDSIYEILMNQGISIYFSDFEEDALELFNELNRANPADPIVMYYQSLCYKKMKSFAEAEKYMQWAIDFSTPDYVADMYHHLGQILGQQRKFAESIDALKKANELKPDNHEVLFEIATTFEEFNSNKTLALNYYRIYLKEAGESGKNVNYALDRISRLKEDLFFEE